MLRALKTNQEHRGVCRKIKHPRIENGLRGLPMRNNTDAAHKGNERCIVCVPAYVSPEISLELRGRLLRRWLLAIAGCLPPCEKVEELK